MGKNTKELVPAFEKKSKSLGNWDKNGRNEQPLRLHSGMFR